VRAIEAQCPASPVPPAPQPQGTGAPDTIRYPIQTRKTLSSPANAASEYADRIPAIKALARPISTTTRMRKSGREGPAPKPHFKASSVSPGRTDLPIAAQSRSAPSIKAEIRMKSARREARGARREARGARREARGARRKSSDVRSSEPHGEGSRRTWHRIFAILNNALVLETQAKFPQLSPPRPSAASCHPRICPSNNR